MEGQVDKDQKLKEEDKEDSVEKNYFNNEN